MNLIPADTWETKGSMTSLVNFDASASGIMGTAEQAANLGKMKYDGKGYLGAGP